MTKEIYIATKIAGRGVHCVTEFNDFDEFLNYADQILADTSTPVNSSDTIDSLCEILADHGAGTGSRTHYPVSRNDAIEILSNKSVKDFTLL